jgi:hypothetical protein
MNRNLAVRSVVAVVVIALLTVPLAARGKAPSTSKGKHTDWGGRIDSIEIVRSFDFSDYGTVHVSGFGTDSVARPPKSENTYEPVKKVLGNVSAAVVEGLKHDLPGKKVSRGKGGKGTIVIRGRVTVMDPGSRAKRYWGGFGAGAARTAISGEAIDAQGRILFRFKQERRSGVGVGGGGYEALLNRNLRAIGEDIAYILKQFN